MFKRERIRPTLVSILFVTMLALPLWGNATNSVLTPVEHFATDLYTWVDPIFPAKGAANVVLRNALCDENDALTTRVCVLITDSTKLNVLPGVHLYCTNTDSEIVSSTESDSTGKCLLRLPKGKFTISVSKLKYSAASRVITVVGDSTLKVEFNLPLVQTSAGYLQVLSGDLAEGNMEDITLENCNIAMTIADGSSDEQLGLATKGKPIDLSTTNGLDGFDWINLPMISTQKLTGIPGSLGSQSKNVRFSSVKILRSTPSISKVLAEGACTDLPLKVKNLYVVKPNQEWFDVTTTIQNVSDTAVSFWLGDAMDNDEDGQTSLYPMRRFGSTVIVSTESGLDEFVPAEPWMGCFGKSDQVFGIFYKGDFAKKFIISANTYRTVSQKFITVQPGGTYVLSRQLAAVPVKKDETHSVALRSCYESTADEWGLRAELNLNTTHAKPGDSIECILSITNISKYNMFEDVAGCISLPAFWEGNVDTVFFGNLAPLCTVEASWTIAPIEGSGNTILTAQALAWREPFAYTEKSIFVEGEGWYAGDNHLHTKFSDGWGTVPDNVKAAKTIGLSFLSCTDHNTTIQDSAVKANSSSEFLVMTGCEVTPNYKLANNWGHAVSLFSNRMIPFSNTQSLASAQEIVTNINALKDGHGFAIMAHPFLKGCPWVYTNVTGFKGIEVWTCFTPVHGTYSDQAFALWDKKNNAGIKQYGFAESDAHNLDMVGRPHIVARLKNLSQEEVEKAQLKGQFYGTNGPDIRFSVDTVIMGGSLTVNSKRTVKINMKAYSAQGIDTMYLLKNGVLIRGFSYPDMMPSVSQVVYDEALPGDFYRMECSDRWSQFAFSNPVFIVPAGQVTPQVIDTISTGMVENNLKMVMFPNPGNEFVKIQTEQPTKATISVYDASSKLWLKAELSNESEKTLDVHALPRGLYIVKINDRRLKLILR